jgi:phage minor structural protein
VEVTTRTPASVLPQLFNISGTRVTVLDNVYNAHVQDALLDANGGQEILDFNIPWGNPKIPFIKNEMTVNFNGVVFRIRTAQSAFDNSGALTYAVHGEALWYDLQATDPRPAINVTTAIAAMNAAVSGTGWTVATVGPATNAAFSVPAGASALAVLRAIPSTFGGELQFDTVNKTVSLLTSRGAQTGLLYARGKNATQDLVAVDTTNFYTRVYPTGVNGIDISTVNAGSKFLEDYSYYDSLGVGTPHVVRAVSIQNTALTTPAQVLSWGQGQLNAMRMPAITYQFGVVVLSGDTIPGLGDTVKVWDKILGYQTSARVVARDIYPLEPTRSSLTINTAQSTLTNNFVAPISSQVTNIAAQDTLSPATPTNVQLTANYSFTGQGTRQITVTVTWNPVTLNTDGSPITDLDHYEVQYQVDSSGVWIPMGNTTDTALMSPLLSMQVSVIARVAAVDHNGNRSTWVQTSGSILADTAPPVQPTPLTLATGNFPLTIEASWNGNTINNHPMAQDSPDFAFLEVHMSTTSGFTPSTSTLIDTIVGSVGGTAVAPGLTPGVTYFFTSVAVDRAANRSPKSTQVSGSTGALPSNYIGSVSISTLVAGSAALGTLHADITVASRIKTADVGARVEMNASGIFAYDAGGTNTVAIHNDGSASFTGTVQATAGSLGDLAVTGALTMSSGGVLRTAPAGSSRVEISTVQLPFAGGGVGEMVRFFTGDGAEGAQGASFPQGVLVGGVNTGAGNRQGVLELVAPQLNSAAMGVAEITLYGGAADNSINPYIQIFATGGTQINNGLTVTDGGIVAGSSATISTAGTVSGQTVTVTGTILNLSDGQITKSSGVSFGLNSGLNASGNVVAPGFQFNPVPGTLSGTTAVISSGGFIAKTSSSRRYKTGIEQAEPRYDILDVLKPVTYFMKDDIAAGYGDSFMREVGLIAEDVHEAGFIDLVQYEIPHSRYQDENGAWVIERTDGAILPESVKYDRIGVMLLPIVKDLRDRVTALEARSA